MIFNRKHTYISIFFVGTMAFGQVKRPNATPYTNEGTFEKLKKKTLILRYKLSHTSYL